MEKWVRLELLRDRGWRRTTTGTHLAGERLWWKRNDTEMNVLRQRDMASKFEDFGGTFAAPPEDTPASNRAWAIRLAQDDEIRWRPDD